MQNIKGNGSNVKEANIYQSIVKYLSYAYPRVIFRFDFAAGMKMTKGQAIKHSLLNPHRGYPDLFICEARGDYHGLFLEIKRKGESPYLKDGQTLKKNIHLLEQSKILSTLQKKGYLAEFAVGFDECMEKIDNYLKLK